MLASFSLALFVVTPTVTGGVLYDSGNPTADEQLVLEYINRARADPIAEGQRLGIDIHEGLSNPSLVGPRPPLAMNTILLGIAQAHSQDMYNLNYFSHTDPNGTTPFDRMAHAGYDYVRAGENMAASTAAAATELEDLMMVDSGTTGRPHRVNLLDLITPYPCSNSLCVYYEVGIGYYAGATSNSIGSDFITEDFGAAANTGPFLLGVVYNDMNHNNFYDIGEGIAGVTITTSSGGYYAVSSSSGGYAIPIGTSGTITVTASGPGFGPVTRTVSLTGVNIKLDFTISSQTSGTTSTSMQTSVTSTLVATSQTTTAIVNNPSIALNLISTSAGSTVKVSGSGFSTGDIGCSFSGSPVGASNCLISNGVLTGLFVVANVETGSYSVIAIGSPGRDFATATLAIASPTITLNPSSAPAGVTVSVSGSGFASADSTCTINGTTGPISSPSCAISGGTITGSFIVANVNPAVYAIAVTGNQAGDSALASFTITANTSSTQTTAASSSNTSPNTASTSTTVTQPKTVASTSSFVTTTHTSTASTTHATSSTSSSISLSTPEALPPIPGFPFESILAGIILGIAALAIGRRRRE
jgi:hypothetical protein